MSIFVLYIIFMIVLRERKIFIYYEKLVMLELFQGDEWGFLNLGYQSSCRKSWRFLVWKRKNLEGCWDCVQYLKVIKYEKVLMFVVLFYRLEIGLVSLRYRGLG